jgi:hypothetical protein
MLSASLASAGNEITPESSEESLQNMLLTCRLVLALGTTWDDGNS